MEHNEPWATQTMSLLADCCDFQGTAEKLWYILLLSFFTLFYGKIYSSRTLKMLYSNFLNQYNILCYMTCATCSFNAMLLKILLEIRIIEVPLTQLWGIIKLALPFHDILRDTYLSASHQVCVKDMDIIFQLSLTP